MKTEKTKTCCFFGHRKIEVNKELTDRVTEAVERLIVEEKVDTFLFGSKSDFDSFCVETVSKLKEKYPHIRRIYVRAEFPYIDDKYKAYLLKSYDDTYYPERITSAGKAVYVERNYEMIDKSNFCIIYFDENYAPPTRKHSKRDISSYQPKSGTKLAYDYAVKKRVAIINVLKKA